MRLVWPGVDLKVTRIDSKVLSSRNPYGHRRCFRTDSRIPPGERARQAKRDRANEAIEDFFAATDAFIAQLRSRGMWPANGERPIVAESRFATASDVLDVVRGIAYRAGIRPKAEVGA